MLILSRKEGESLLIGANVTVIVKRVGRGRVQICVKAPKRIAVRRTEIASQHRELHGWLKFWERFSLILGEKIRTETFEPSFTDLQRHFARTWPTCQGKWSRRWWHFAIACRTAWMVAQCLKAAGLDRLLVALKVYFATKD